MINVYLAAGWFNKKQLDEIQCIEKMLSTRPRISMYSPRLENSCPPDAEEHIKKQVFEQNIVKIINSNLLIVNTADKDLGTIFESGVAYAFDVPIIYFCNGLHGTFNLMLAKSGIAVATTFVELGMHIDNFIKNHEYTSEYTGGIE